MTGHPLRIAFAGVAHSHAFSDARNLRARGAVPIGVWDADDPARTETFVEEFAVPAVPDLSALLALSPDLVVVTVRTPRAVQTAQAIADAGVPSFCNKTIAATPRAFADWAGIVDPRRFTSSVLRFAPALGELVQQLGGERLRRLEVTVQHSIAVLLESKSWQDQPLGAGGTLVNFGVHAWEMVDVLLPGARARVIEAEASTHGLPTASEASGRVLAHLGEVEVAVSVSGVDATDVYAVRAITDAGEHRIDLPADAAALGYHGAADAMLATARSGVGAVAPERTAAVYANTFAAAAAARSALR